MRSGCSTGLISTTRRDEENRTVRLVTSLRNDVLTDNISKDSPFGRALLGRKTGETVMVRVNEKGKLSGDHRRGYARGRMTPI